MILKMDNLYHILFVLCSSHDVNLLRKIQKKKKGRDSCTYNALQDCKPTC